MDSIPVEHEEEMLVLKSIFNEDFIVTDDENIQSAFDLIIRFDSLPSKIVLACDDPSKMSSEIAHLPPITFHVRYKNTYPEVEPPFYCIQCDYLTCDQLQLLANQLDSVWIPGEVVVYTWIETLREYFYQMTRQFTLSEAKSSFDDERFRSNYNRIGWKTIYQQLREYDRLQNQLQFEKEDHTCPICLEDKSGRDCLRFEKCEHFACVACLKSHAIQYLSNAQQNKPINCYDCDSPLFLSELRRIFSNDQLLSKYQQRLLEQTTDMVWCPRCHHPIVCVPSESTSGNHRSFVECFHCEFLFCRRCEETWHPQVQCPKAQLLENIKHDSTSNNQQRQNAHLVDLKKLMIEIDNVAMIARCTKPCPACSVRIEKNGGCQHMYCRVCLVHFCWTCGWFGKAYGPHECREKPVGAEKALPSDVAEKLEQVMHDKNGAPIPRDIARRVQLCPRENCRQAHLKVGTRNMLHCEKCRNYFCFLCGEAVYGDYHYSEYGCKLNTPL